MDNGADSGLTPEAEFAKGATQIVHAPSGLVYKVRRLRRSKVIGLLGNIPDVFEAVGDVDPAKRRARITDAVRRADPVTQIEQMESIVAAGLVHPRISDDGVTLDALPPEDFGVLFAAIWDLAGMGPAALGEAQEEMRPTSATPDSASSSTESPVATSADQAT